MKLTSEHVQSIIKRQTKMWVLATLSASCYALFAKLVWTAKFPILIFLPIMMIGFALGSINSIRTSLASFVEEGS